MIKLPKLIGLFAACLSMPIAAQSEDKIRFCKVFNLVYETRLQNFDKFKGLGKSKSKTSDSYSLVVLPNADYCSIFTADTELPDRSSFHCAWRFDDGAAAVAAARELASSVKACLSKPYENDAGSGSESALFVANIWDNNPNTNSKIRVIKAEKTNGTDKFVIFFTIENHF